MTRTPRTDAILAEPIGRCPICGAGVRVKFDPTIAAATILHDGQATAECRPALQRVFLPRLTQEGKAP